MDVISIRCESMPMTQFELMQQLESNGYAPVGSQDLPQDTIAYMGSVTRQRKHTIVGVYVIDPSGLPAWPVYRKGQTANNPLEDAINNLNGRLIFLATSSTDSRHYISKKQRQLLHNLLQQQILRERITVK